MSESNSSSKGGSADTPPLYPGGLGDEGGSKAPSPWPSRLWMALKIGIVFTLFIVYAGYAHRSGSTFGGEPTFVDSPGFSKFSQSSGISGLINVASGMWGRALGKQAPLDTELVDAPSGEMMDDVVALSSTDEGMIEEGAAEEVMDEADDEVILDEQELAVIEQEPSQDEVSNCAKIPDVLWWKNKTQEEARQYVNLKYDGDWKPYIAKWEEHLTKVIDVYVAGKKAMIQETKTVLTGEELADYVNQIEERISVIHCFARNTVPKESPL